MHAINKNITIKGAPLIKFQSKERIKSFRDGVLYANKLSYYRQREEETDDSTVGDKLEAMWYIHDGVFIDKETGERQELHDQPICTTHSDDFVFCMFGISENISAFQYTDLQKSEILGFGDTALIITDKQEFINRVCAAAEKEGYQVKFGAVNYYNLNEDYVGMALGMLNGVENIAFWKRNQYSYQQEARFVFYGGDMSKDHLILNIGDISDISEVVPVDVALNGLIEKA